MYVYFPLVKTHNIVASEGSKLPAEHFLSALLFISIIYGVHLLVQKKKKLLNQRVVT